MEKLAVFDFDKTLTTKDTTLIIAKYFTVKTKRYIRYVNFLFWGVLYKLRIASNKKVKNELLKIINGTDRETIYKLVERLYDVGIKPILRESTVKEIVEYKKRGYRTVLLSAQFDFIVKEVFKRLMFDTYIATRTDLDKFEVNGDVFEGKKKAEAIKLLFDGIDYENSIAFADNKRKDVYLGEVVKNIIWVE
ncbi:HAD-IB family phosphatase [candidate division WOR-3 bacterium]|nr:HAD-IB family phosphatase [candidate division WOR-3 bacterium]